MSDTALVTAITYTIVGVMLVEDVIEQVRLKRTRSLEFTYSLVMSSLCLIIGFVALLLYLS